MKRRSLRRAAALSMLLSCFAAGCAGASPRFAAPEVALPEMVSRPSPPPVLRADLAGLVDEAVSPDPAVARRAIDALRAAGPAGLDALFAAHAAGIARLTTGGKGDPDLDRLRAAIERVSRQRDAHASRLYWYTDLGEAVRAARAAHKPILSLRLLGDLDEELSCANSRFFRTALYPNERVGRLLREGFVLYWKSERPAPRMTIDFGDGRKVVRTLTGNSVHYILDEEGHPIDALPGLYGPEAFLRGLAQAREVAIGVMGLPLDQRAAFVRAHHDRSLRLLRAEWEDEVAALGAPGAPLPVSVTGVMPAPMAGQMPMAAMAANLAPSKAMVEVPVVQALQGTVPPLPKSLEDKAWGAMVARRADLAKLDAKSLRLMRAKIAVETTLDDASFTRRVSAFERSMAEDTVFNELGMHRRVREWFAAGSSDDLERLNQRVYSELFLTPRADPWLGLVAPDGYAAIDGEGLVVGEGAR